MKIYAGEKQRGMKLKYENVRRGWRHGWNIKTGRRNRTDLKYENEVGWVVKYGNKN